MAGERRSPDNGHRMSRDRNRAPSQRQLRVGEEIRHALAEIFEREEFRDPDLADVSITVTEVRVSADLRQATVYVMPLGGGATDKVIAGLSRVKSFLRRHIARAVQLKFVPDLHFRTDETFDEASRIDRLLRDPAVARDLERREDEDDAGTEENKNA
jgi:ribosome-binding factor A